MLTKPRTCSLGSEPWKFLVIQDLILREKMMDLIVEQYKAFQEGTNILESERTVNDWAAKQTYIALGNMITAAAMIGIDSAPMEGFNVNKLDALLEE